MAVFAWVIPIDGNACVFITSHVELYSVVLLENIEETVEVFNPHISNPKIIDDYGVKVLAWRLTRRSLL